MYADRKRGYERLEKEHNSKVLAYVTGDRPGWETQIHPEVLDHFVHHLDAIGVTKRITLYLYTCGGSALASWSIAHLIRHFCDELEIIVPSKARSGGTLICLGADKIIMTKQATLGPIDPSVNGALNPQVPGAGPQARVPVSVEAINGFIEFARKSLGEDARDGMASVMTQLISQVHPLVLGDAYRSRAQIRMLARRLVGRQLQDESKIERVLNFLCSESGSHDYAIFRREARDELGLNIQKPDDDGYKLIKSVYDDLANELLLTTPYDPNVVLGQEQTAPYEFRRALIESVHGGSHVHISKGTLQKRQIQLQPGLIGNAVQDERTFEGWRHEN